MTYYLLLTTFYFLLKNLFPGRETSLSSSSNKRQSQVIPPLKEDDRIQGSLDATVILMEYGDYQCPQSGQAIALIKVIQQQLGEQFCFVFRHFPQSKRSLRAAESAEAAAVQNRFWQMHDLLFDRQQHLEDHDLVRYADRLGLEMSRFLGEMSTHVHLVKIQNDLDSGKANGAEEAPTFFIGVKHRGTKDLETLVLTILRINRNSQA